ncbi:SpoIIE family protein phosphatase [Microtetraspora sp. NBRC 16547]|uniref:SpoIIE family protein phosphatase n=1 Tax=Microtetraspora sp. NBRC 16547 TaxID=3030993 RepID=UPI0025566284|nr:SpoIIE family protein phosphatase [Microtetraspora sp. NBRC 16547]
MTAGWNDTDALTEDCERFLTGGPVGAGVRTSVLTSWQRCQSLGIRADQVDIPYHQDLDLESDLIRAAGPVIDQLNSALYGMPMGVLLCDEQARIIDRRVDDPSLNRVLDARGLAPGFGYAEQFAGTNGIGTALVDRRPVLIHGREHFVDALRIFSCAGIPIRDPLSGQSRGLLDLTCLCEDADPAMLALAREAARSIERRLLDQSTERERALLRTFFQAHRAAGGAPPASLLRPEEGEPVGPGASGGDLLNRHDRLILQEKAAELISSGHAAIVEVPLPHGRAATLLSRPVTSSSGETGVAVEAVLPGGALRRLATTARPVLPYKNVTPSPITLSPPYTTASPDRSALTEPPSVTDKWLIAVGEPGVGRLALLARQRLELLTEAGIRIGTTLDVTRTAEELTEVAIPRLADFVTVDLPDAVLRGEEPTNVSGAMRRVALGAVSEGSHLYPVGDLVTFVPATPQARCLATGQSVLSPLPALASTWLPEDPARAEKVRARGIHSAIAVPLLARGVVLGVASFYRLEHQGPFEEDDLSLAEELAGRAAVCIDNARRFTLERTTALTLQRSLLPHGLPEQTAVEAAHRYLPAQAGVGGDWFDIIPLSGARVALVVGDVVGHGLHASATMGRLRTAVQNFSDLDLPVDEVLAHLDDLVGRLDLDEDPDGAAGAGIIGATCLYAVYDPVSQRCTMARAGHPAPALVLPDGTVELPEVPAGPPLGLGCAPFETVDIAMPEGSQLILYTDGLIEHRDRDIDVAIDQLRCVLTHPDRPPEETCDALLGALLPAQPSDDVALLVARTRALNAQQVAQWDVPADPAAVSGIRTAVTRQLADWDMEELTFSTELMISELVTNAIRYAGAPIQVRLLRDRTLICEVSDGSCTSPRLRRAATTDEGGRGLFLVAQLAQRWGTRHTADGKVIWTEQPLSSFAAL